MPPSTSSSVPASAPAVTNVNTQFSPQLAAAQAAAALAAANLGLQPAIVQVAAPASAPGAASPASGAPVVGLTPLTHFPAAQRDASQ
jgi:hypothetical protein